MMHSDGRMDEFVINSSERDRCIKMNGKILLVQNIIASEGQEYIVCKEYRQIASFFDYPIDSSDLGICFGSDLSSHLMCLRLDTKFQKCVRLPLEAGFVVVPLLHAD